MNDAAEVLEAIFESLKVMADGTDIVNRSFGINMEEKVHCHQCGKDTHEHKYTEHFHTVSATALRIMSAASEVAELGPLLQQIHLQDEKKCDKEKGEYRLMVPALIAVACDATRNGCAVCDVPSNTCLLCYGSVLLIDWG